MSDKIIPKGHVWRPVEAPSAFGIQQPTHKRAELIVREPIKCAKIHKVYFTQSGELYKHTGDIPDEPLTEVTITSTKDLSNPDQFAKCVRDYLTTITIDGKEYFPGKVYKSVEIPLNNVGPSIDFIIKP